MRLKLLLALLMVALLSSVVAVTVFAQGDAPPPYAGMKNPFPWTDTTAQQAGKRVYQQNCVGCHGPTGGNIQAANFSAADSPNKLEAKPDYYFWVLSEGRLDKGMPPYKSSLSEQQRWQTLTYMWTLGQATTVPPTTPGAEVKGALQLATAPQATTGEELTLTATLKDEQGKPVPDVAVKFLQKVDFFAKGDMEIGSATTNEQGVASLKYVSRSSGDVTFVARTGTFEGTVMVKLAEAAGALYHPEIGLKFPTIGPEVFVGPQSAHQLGEGGRAPNTALRLPGGILSWLLPVILTIALIWFTYFRVMFQVFRIPILSDMAEVNLRLVPAIGLAIIVILGTLLVLMFATGPFSHFHTPPNE
ncbi:MAG: c-type cytochrome [Chloroflexi bacterium]|nr:c-type cytochrome [Chloroflexota bacterium]